MLYDEETLELLQDEFSGSRSDFMMIDGEEEEEDLFNTEDEDDVLPVDGEEKIGDDEEDEQEWE